MRAPLNSQLIRWGLAFLSQCNTECYRKNTMAVLQLSMRSAALMTDLQSRTSVEFSYRRAGKLVLQDSEAAMLEAGNTCALKREHGSDAQVITMDQAIEIEPALQHMTNQYAGAIYSRNDEVGDSLAFTNELGQWLAGNRDVEFQLQNRVQEIAVKDGKLSAVITDSKTLKPDAVVVCLGAWSDRFLRPLGIGVNIYPMRGYSVTLPAVSTSNTTSITDLGSKTVFSRLGDQVRIAGFADFVGFSTKKDADRTRMLLETANKTAPSIADYNAASVNEWGGFRPMTPNSQPMVGPSPIEGIHLNTGHGMLGWTLACATGFDVAANV
jgi:D-amino-acid dehydrogenase